MQSHLKTHGDKSGVLQHNNNSSSLSAMVTPSSVAAGPASSQLTNQPFNAQLHNSDDAIINKQGISAKLDRFKHQNRTNGKSISSASSQFVKNSSEKTIIQKRHYCDICHKRFATEGVIRQHLCSRQSNVSFIRNNEGSLILKANSLSSQLLSNESNLNK